jgi:hypothetical protein
MVDLTDNQYLLDYQARYEGVDQGLWEGSKAERDALRARGINPKYFRPYLAGPYRGFEFSGDFADDLRRLNELYIADGGQNAEGVGRSPTGAAGFDYKAALDSLFEHYPDVETKSGQHYLNISIH